MTESVRLVVFARLPRPGETKTRLAEEWGEAKAAALYAAWVPPLVQRLLGSSLFSVEIALAPSPAARLDEAREWLGIDTELLSFQVGDGLGRRLAHAFDRSFSAGFQKVLIIGSDSPQLTVSDIQVHSILLETHDVVLGPAEDGGYWLVGLRRRPENLFEKVRWSTPDTLADTQQAARAKGWSVGMGPMRLDIDTPRDLIKFLATDLTGEWGYLRAILDHD